MRAKKFTPPTMQEIYARLTNQLIERMEGGEIPWVQPWRPKGNARNLVSGKVYRGFNQLALTALGAKYESPYWLTYNQALDLGGHVKKGEASTPIIFWKVRKNTPTAGVNAPAAPDDDGGEGDLEGETAMPLTSKIRSGPPLLRYYCVFNADQCEGLQTKVDLHPGRNVQRPTPTEAHENAKGIIERADLCPMKINGRDAAYVPSLDEIWMPRMEQFDHLDDFYHVAFHEMSHATGHKSRIGRLVKLTDATAAMRRGSYAKEELVAEMSAAYLANAAGLDMGRITERSAAYLQSWLARCKQEPELLVNAAQQAQHATDWVLGLHMEQQKRRAEKDAAVVLTQPSLAPGAEPVPAYSVESVRSLKAGDVVRYYQPGTADFATGVLTGESERNYTVAGLLDLPKSQVISLATKDQASAQELYVATPDGTMNHEQATAMASKWSHLNLTPVQSKISGNWICAKPQGYPVQSVTVPATEATLYVNDDPAYRHDTQDDIYLGHLDSPESRADLYFTQRAGKIEVAVRSAQGCMRCKDPKGMAAVFGIAHDRARHVVEAQRSVERDQAEVEAGAPMM